MKTATKTAKPASAKAAKQTKTPVKVTEINLSDEPFNGKEYQALPDSEKPDIPDEHVVHFKGESAWLYLPGILANDSSLQGYEIRLKYEDEEVRITGDPSKLFAASLEQEKDFAVRLIFDSLGRYTDEELKEEAA